MRIYNLICAYQGAEAIDSLTKDKKLKVLKPREIDTLKSFCNQLLEFDVSYENFDGYYIGYTIKQIGKEFDLLRFGDHEILNIELKSQLNFEKILDQMQKNYYYLKFLEKPLTLITYVQNIGFYWYDPEKQTIVPYSPDEVANKLKEHIPNYEIDPDEEFVPSHYLVSPFNSTDKFIKGEYFLTPQQQTIKDEIKVELNNNTFKYFCLSANAGTGKTLLIYDIAKESLRYEKKVIVIHTGKLNDGHKKLNSKYGWKIYSISGINNITIKKLFNSCDLLIVDEAQRTRTHQLEWIIDYSKSHNIPIIFSYDPKQYLRSEENHDIKKYLKDNHPSISIISKRLTSKIRTNKELASFITNLFEIGKSKDNLDYNDVTIDYISDNLRLKQYIDYLKDNQGWQPITYTPSLYSPDPFDPLNNISDKKAHDVIGQEFLKVVLIMDENFKYHNNCLVGTDDAYYSATGMLYQITTRVVNKLKIVVVKNPELYLKLLEIKSMGTK